MIRNFVFGQFLIEHDVITSETLHKALAIQEKEKLEDKKTSPRLPGRILLEDFQSFKDEEELAGCLEELKKFKAYIEAQHAALKSLEN